jgi:hypothetical protein
MSNLVNLQWDLPQDPRAGHAEQQRIRIQLAEWERVHQHGLPNYHLGGSYMMQLTFDEDDSWTTVFLVTWQGKPWTRIQKAA